MKILIVKLSAFGDIIHALPALDDVLARPQVDEIHWLVDTRYAFVTRMLPDRVRVHAVPLREPGRWRKTWRVVRRLRRIRFDAVLDLQGLMKSALLARLAGGPVFGLDAAHMREPLARWLEHPVRFHPDERHVVQQLRRVANAPFDMPETAPGALRRQPDAPIPYVPPALGEAMRAKLRGQAARALRRMGANSSHAWLHIGGGWETKLLPPATWQAVARGLMARSLTPILGWGTNAEHAVARTISEAAPGSIVPPGRLDAPALAGVLATAACVVGPDTGVVHLAAALGAPTVSFWGPSASWRSGPQGPHHRHVESSPPCGPCFRRRCNQFICMDMIRANDILAAIDEIRT